jgi:ketosteroid isomerase-like protein
MRRTVALYLVLALVLAAAATSCGSRSAGVSARERTVARRADLYAIGRIEVAWHKASSTHDVDLMMSLWADDATFTVGGETYTGKDGIRNFFANEAAPFQAENHWISDSPAYKERITVDGDTGTLYFECDYIDLKTEKIVAVVSADQDVKRIGGRWLITNSIAATPSLSAGY